MTNHTAITKHYAKRQRAACRFKWYGRLAIAFSCLMLAILLSSVIARGWSGFLVTEIKVPTSPIAMSYGVSANSSDAQGAEKSLESSIRFLTGNLVEHGPYRKGLELFSINARNEFSQAAEDASSRVAFPDEVWLTAATDVDLWKKGILTDEQLLASGKVTSQQFAWLQSWNQQGLIELGFNHAFLSFGDSREPELAGFAASIIGSLLTVGVCLLLAFPLGVMTAVYLEEFAKKNRINDVIEVNINNLAAVPSIVFGLLGLALYLNFFGMPRSASLVGGLTLALLILPVIIIATRAALRAVPASIRDAARGLGATELQVVMHHVLPLSLPGIMTGTILGTARAIGETAPLLMIGMVAFIADIPGNALAPATAMPVQIFLWASSPETGFIEKTAAGIIVLLVLLMLMNLTAIWVRNRFEYKW